jgi:hypothetical protein
MTKYKTLYRAVQHLTHTDFQPNGRDQRRTDGHRGAERYGKTAAWRIASARTDARQAVGSPAR